MRRMQSVALVCLIAAQVLAGPATDDLTTAWRPDAPADGDWFDSSHWTVQVPAAGDDAGIDGGSATISAGDAEVHSLSVGLYDAASVHQTGGKLQVADNLWIGCGPGSSGTYVLADGELAADRVHIGLYGGDSLFRQTGGTIAGDSAPSGSLSILPAAGPRLERHHSRRFCTVRSDRRAERCPIREYRID